MKEIILIALPIIGSAIVTAYFRKNDALEKKVEGKLDEDKYKEDMSRVYKIIDDGSKENKNEHKELDNKIDTKINSSIERLEKYIDAKVDPIKESLKTITEHIMKDKKQ